MGLAISAVATICAGELTVAPLDGIETHTEPAEVEPGDGGGSGAGLGNAATPVEGPIFCVATISGHETGAGVGVEAGGGVGDGGGEEFVTGVLLIGPVAPPHPAWAAIKAAAATVQNR
jgi:hypothetical protein